jgi:hypothetical protein
MLPWQILTDEGLSVHIRAESSHSSGARFFQRGVHFVFPAFAMRCQSRKPDLVHDFACLDKKPSRVAIPRVDVLSERSALLVID